MLHPVAQKCRLLTQGRLLAQIRLVTADVGLWGGEGMGEGERKGGDTKGKRGAGRGIEGGGRGEEEKGEKERQKKDRGREGGA